MKKIIGVIFSIYFAFAGVLPSIVQTAAAQPAYAQSSISSDMSQPLPPAISGQFWGFVFPVLGFVARVVIPYIVKTVERVIVGGLTGATGAIIYHEYEKYQKD